LQYHLDKATTFNTEILGATWDESLMLWKLETKDLKTGATKLWTCNLLVSAAGQFSVPKKAPISGLDNFKGQEWHTVDWPKNAALAGKKVGIIGTGPSAAQLIPRIYKDVGKLVVYQRSPSYCLPRDDFVAGPLRKWIFATFPVVRKVYKWWLTKMV
jgi:cation diffusion facilitator CzcD-associated flavoprotein CzcO